MSDIEAALKQRRDHTAALVRSLGGRATARQVSRHIFRFRNPRMATALLESMAQRGYGRWEPKPTGARGGRPTRVFVLSEGYGDADGATGEKVVATSI